MTPDKEAFSSPERAAVYRVLRERRDVRHFQPYAIQDDVLTRLLEAAHTAPSVGFMQPWDLIVVQDHETRERIRAHVLSEKEKA